MFGYATIAGGPPSGAAAMTSHLLTQTLPRAEADLARYYTRGMQAGTEEERLVDTLARQVGEGTLGYASALDELAADHLARTGNIDLDVEDRLAKQLADAAFRYGIGEGEVTAAEPRRDMHPLVARGLGIDPDLPLSREAINNLLSGHRADGEAIAGKHYARHRTSVDPRTGERKDSGQIGSVDFCLTPDKSVSVAWAFAGPAEQAIIFQAHREAAHAAMLHLEQEIGRARKGGGGRDGYDPGHIGWVAFDHYTARPTIALAVDGETTLAAVPGQVAGDPDLHTHFTVMNAVFCDNGRVGSLDLNRLEGFLMEADGYYQAHLATNLRQAGFDVVLDDRTGAARMPAIPEAVRAHFSKRTNRGEEAARDYAREQGLDWDALSPERRVKLLKSGTQDPARLNKDDVADFGEWRAQAAALGWEPQSFLAYGPPTPALSREARIALAYEAAQPFLEAELGRRAVIAGSDARTAAARGLIASGVEEAADIDRVTAAFRECGVRQNGEMTALLWSQEEDRKHVTITTELHAAQEQEFCTLARAAAADRSAALTRSALQAAIARSGLSFAGEHGAAQLAAIERLGSGGRLGAVVGAAGSGKTTLLRPLVDAWGQEGRAVYGVALAWRQADDLTEAGIAAANVKAFSVFIDASRKGGLVLDRRSVVVVDELALLGTRQGLELLRLQAEHGFQLAVLGDDRQCQAIEAGPIVDLMRRALGPEQVPEILTTVRQESERERSIAGAFREGRAMDALAMKRDDGTAELVPGGYAETVQRIADLWAERMRANRHDPSYSLSVSAPTNADAHRLSEAIRDRRRELGLLGQDAMRLRAVDRDGREYDMALAVGDRVRLFRSTGARFGDARGGAIGRNGSVLEVRAIDQEGVTLRTGSGRTGQVSWASLTTSSGRVLLGYGDVMTVNTAQGLTSIEHIDAMPAGTKAVTGFAAYTGGSRHRRRSFLVISQGAERQEITRRRALNDPRPITRADEWANVARNLSRQPERDSALAFLERSEHVRRGAVRMLQHGLQPLEDRARRGETPTVLRDNLERRQAERRLTGAVQRFRATTQGHEAMLARLAALGTTLRDAFADRFGTSRWRQTGEAASPGSQERGPRLRL
jgi:hypothetical protein